ncbi:hypothetical protein [Corynebacterium bovis]|uniref:hypothetical protein n=1 Tax=Corynebacterium bovis TaxID=36808 RepID=UPI00163AC43D|nr:hypothetical protein [Corynebacterium bovis]
MQLSNVRPDRIRDRDTALVNGHGAGTVAAAGVWKALDETLALTEVDWTARPEDTT